MDMELPMIPVASQEATDVSPTSSWLSSLQNEPSAIIETSKPIDPRESLPECPGACEDKQEGPTPLENLAKDLHLSESTEPRQDDEISLTDGIIDPEETIGTFKPNAVVKPSWRSRSTMDDAHKTDHWFLDV